jgi:hypothetical protein
VPRWFSGRGRTALTFVLGVMVATAATAGATSLITGRQIKDGTVAAKDLSKAVRKQLAKHGRAGAVGPQGPVGATGPMGPQGAQGPSGVPPNQTIEFSAAAARGGTIATGGCVDLDSAVAYLDLPLPAGAVITQIRARYVDNSPGQDLQFSVRHSTLGGTLADPVAIGASSDAGSPGVAVLTSDPGTVFPAVSDQSWYYMYGQSATTHTGELAFCGAAVDYHLAP